MSFLKKRRKKWIKRVMREFDFDKVQNHMNATGWTWACSDGVHVPTVDQLKETAEQLMWSAVSACLMGDGPGLAVCGGFVASAHHGCIGLHFELESWECPEIPID